MEEEKNEVIAPSKTEAENALLKKQVDYLAQQLHQANLANMFKRMDYLFKVVEYSRSFRAEFVASCIEEIEQMMTLPEEEKTEE